MSRFSICACLLSAIPFAASAQSGAPAQEREPARSVLKSQAYCSKERPGVSVAEIRWAIGSKGKSVEELQSSLQAQVLDVTVYKDGFDRGLFRTVRPSLENSLFESKQQTNVPAIPGLENLRLVGFSDSIDHPASGFQLQALRREGVESAVARVEGLAGGTHYFWRISSPDGPANRVTLAAAICPVDEVKPFRRPEQAPVGGTEGRGDKK